MSLRDRLSGHPRIRLVDSFEELVDLVCDKVETDAVWKAQSSAGTQSAFIRRLRAAVPTVESLVQRRLVEEVRAPLATLAFRGRARRNPASRPGNRRPAPASAIPGGSDRGGSPNARSGTKLKNPARATAKHRGRP